MERIPASTAGPSPTALEVDSSPAGTIDLRVGCEIRIRVPVPVHAVMQVEPVLDTGSRVLSEHWDVQPAAPSRPYHDRYSNRCRRLDLPDGVVSIRYDARVEASDSPTPFPVHAPETPAAELPDDVLVYTLPSRYCESDRLADVAWSLFGGLAPGYLRVQGICDWVHQNITFSPGSTTPLTSAFDVFQQRTGVCRDFAHMGVAFCRAFSIPTRYCFGYLPDIGLDHVPDEPMDFCAWMETYLGDRWYTFDPRNNRPRIGHVLIGRGRDALDVAMLTTFGAAPLEAMRVIAEPADEPSSNTRTVVGAFSQ